MAYQCPKGKEGKEKKEKKRSWFFKQKKGNAAQKKEIGLPRFEDPRLPSRLDVSLAALSICCCRCCCYYYYFYYHFILIWEHTGSPKQIRSPCTHLTVRYCPSVGSHHCSLRAFISPYRPPLPHSPLTLSRTSIRYRSSSCIRPGTRSSVKIADVIGIVKSVHGF